MKSEFYSFDPKLPGGKSGPLSDHAGKVILIVNTASKCGFTPQYEGLQKLYEDYREKGFVILGFPCDQFANQEPGTDQDIAQFCKLNFGVSFPLYSKVEVNGKNADPVFKYLRKKLPGKLGGRIKWNFTKFLIDRNGTPFKRYAPTASPASLENDIKSLL